MTRVLHGENIPQHLPMTWISTCLGGGTVHNNMSMCGIGRCFSAEHSVRLLDYLPLLTKASVTCLLCCVCLLCV